MAGDNEKLETVSNILAEMRQGMNPNGTAECQYLESDICTLADRIEAARTTEKSSAVGNAAARREALNRARRTLSRWKIDAPVSAWNEFDLAMDEIDSALSAPARNCDVGTAEEQSDRFANLCDSHSGCSQCPVKSLWNFANGHKPSCGVLWAQMPYEAQEGGVK